MKTLVVDDEPSMRFMLEQVLRARGHDVTACGDGESAWKIYQNEAFPIALVDWRMPGMDGLELCRLMRSAPHGDQTVILVITACDRLEDLQAVLEAGADDYLAKPVQIKHLKVRLTIAEKKVADIVERKRIETAIVRAKQEWERTFDSVPDLITILDTDCRIMRINRAMADRLGRSPRELVGIDCRRLAPAPDQNIPAWLADAAPAPEVRERNTEIHDEALGGDFHVTESPLYDTKGKLIGSVYIARDITERKRAEKQLAQARRQEVEIASNIQKNLLLAEPPSGIFGVQVKAFTIPSEQVDGDFFDFFEHSDRCFDVVVGDVMGKGIPAALQGAAVKSEFLRAKARVVASSKAWPAPEPEEIVHSVHTSITPKLIGLDSSVTVCYARFDQAERQVKYVDCGHTKTIHYRASLDRSEYLQGDNVPLGYLEEENYQQRTASFDLGDVFFFYSDGLTDARALTGDFFGEDRVADIVRRVHNLAAQDIINAVLEEAMTFIRGGRLADDVTCVVIKMVGHRDWIPLLNERIAFSSALDELNTFRNFLRGFCAKAPAGMVPEGALDSVELAANEALSNIMRHAYAGRPDEKIETQLELYPDRLYVRFFDTAPLFRPTRIRPPTFEPSRMGGYGLYIMDQCVDEVKYYRTEDGRSCTCLAKKLTPP